MCTDFPAISQRRACELLSIPRSSCRYRAKPNPINEALKTELRELAMENPRYGYRRLHVLVERHAERRTNRRVSEQIESIGCIGKPV